MADVLLRRTRLGPARRAPPVRGRRGAREGGARDGRPARAGTTRGWSASSANWREVAAAEGLGAPSPCRRAARGGAVPTPGAPRRPRDPPAARPRARPHGPRSWASSTPRPTRSPTGRARRSRTSWPSAACGWSRTARDRGRGWRVGRHGHRGGDRRGGDRARRAAWSSGWRRRGALVSVDTWRGPVARAALAAGAHMINDVSGLSEPGVADACAEAGAALVITHTRRRRRRRSFPDYDDVVDDVRELPRASAWPPRARGRAATSGSSSTRHRHRQEPAESVELLRRLPRAGRAGPAAAAGGVPQGLHRRADRAAAGRARLPARWPRWALRSTAARRSCACTTWPRTRDFLRVHDALAARRRRSRLALGAGAPEGRPA